jgi:hypothetical protein
LNSVPELGQLAEVRRRRYVVSDARRSAVSRSAIKPKEFQHLVSLVSSKDEALGEERQVTWELEPAARAFDKPELPASRGFDAPAKLDTFLDAVRVGCRVSGGHQNDPSALLQRYRNRKLSARSRSPRRSDATRQPARRRRHRVGAPGRS